MSVDVVILAAGQGTRMRSRLPKVLHPLAGGRRLAHGMDVAAELDAKRAIDQATRLAAAL
mgnify:CR=1 FL=1